MPSSSRQRQFWKTSSFGGSVDTSALELAALRTHLDLCDTQRGALFSVRCGLDAVGRFAAPRLVTGLILFTLVSIVATCVGA
jgi:hypothetical protein